ncbi:MAG: glycosyltransferase family 4 protein [Kiritimatiellae bacterium]|nr:glycosyltransferase family 4 protein [Kiritimatiellia bacterium]
MTGAGSSPIHAALDMRWIFRELSGIGRYTRELASELARTADGRRLTLLFHDPEIARREMDLLALPAGSAVQSRVFPFGPFSPRAQISWPRLLRSLDAQVYHAPNFMVPLGAFPASRPPGRLALVVTLHDLIPVLHPEFTPKARKNMARGLVRRLMREAARRADLIITPSAHTRGDVLTALDPNASPRIRVVPEAAGAMYAPGNAPPVPGQILFVGRRDPYKNLTGVMEAFATVARSVPGAKLRVVSAPDPRYPEAEHLASLLGISDRVEWSGYVDGPRLLEAYRQAHVFVLPSLYEGFGLPILEAMACGTPVVCSGVSSLPEVAGDAALMVDPRDPAALAGALTSVLTDPALAARLRTAGLERARKFSWNQAARTTWSVYEEAVAARQRRPAS